MTATQAVEAAPFLRWPGGKSWFARAHIGILRSLPTDRYFEPFLGSGAVYFSLGPRRAHLSDINGPLINAFVQVRDQPSALIRHLRAMEASPDAYALIRTLPIENGVEEAARFLYLNRMAFGGLYRVNRAGLFNVPYGGDRRLDYFWRDDRIVRASQALRGVRLKKADFETSIASATDGDLVYCDPVYLLPENSESFRRYTAPPFGSADLDRLVKSVAAAVSRGAIVALSWTGDPPSVALGDFHSVELTRTSTVSANAARGTTVFERLIVYARTSDALTCIRARG